MSEIFSPLFGNLIGGAIVEGQPEPSDPIAPAQNDGDAGEMERSGRWPDPMPSSTDPAESPLNYPPVGRQVENHPTPLIGTVPFGGIVVDAGQIVGQPLGGGDTYAVIGDNIGSRPGILGIWLIWQFSSTVPPARILPDGAGLGSLTNGAAVTNMNVNPMPLFLPVRRLSILVPESPDATVGRLNYVVIGSDLGQST